MSIILDHVSYTYGSHTPNETYAVKDISLTIEENEFIGVIGQTGSGKSTLMQLLNGLIMPTDGSIYFNGADISDKDYDRKMLRSKVGLVFQYPEHQLFESTVFKDVCFGPQNLGLKRKEVELRAFSALEQMGVDSSVFYQSPFDLSGGQKRRVAIAGVLAMKPDVLILDEPTAGLDPHGRERMLMRISNLHSEERKTILLVSHSMEDIADCVDRVLVLHDGELYMDGTPKEVFGRADELEQIGLAAPQASYIVKELQKRGVPVRANATTLEEAQEEILRVFGKVNR